MEVSYSDLKREYDRAKIFVKAIHDLLQRQVDSHYVLNLLEETVFYDDADCDGYCLYEETGEWLEWQNTLINKGDGDVEIQGSTL